MSATSSNEEVKKANNNMHHKIEITDLEPTADQSETTLAVETHLNAEVSQLSWQDIARIVNRFMFVFACLFTVLIYLRFFSAWQHWGWFVR